jgi:hypothetical protein
MREQKKEVPLLRSLALDLIDTEERREQTLQLLNEFLPHLAADIENSLHEQEAIVHFELFIEQQHSKIRFNLKLKKLEHEFLIHIDSKNAMFVIGSERGGEHANNALQASQVLKTMLMKFKAK